jgi:hypothetical protein
VSDLIRTFSDTFDDNIAVRDDSMKPIVGPAEAVEQPWFT